jgi:hypothetical protein
VGKHAVAIILMIGGVLLMGRSPPAAAAEMQPGRWTFTQETRTGAGVKRTRTVRCVRPAEAADPVRYFAPRGGGRAAACELLENSVFSGRISSRLRCTAGQTSMELGSIINIDTPTHLTIRTTLSTNAGPRQSSNVGMSGEGVRIGNCR